MNLLAPISSIMQTDLITLEKKDTIAQVAAIFKKHNIHHIPVVDGKKLIGIVSKSDFLFFQRGFSDSFEEQLVDELRMKHYEVEKIMTSGIAKMEPTDKINVALELFKINAFHAIPIVEEDELVGLVTTYDLLKRVGIDKSVVNQYELV